MEGPRDEGMKTDMDARKGLLASLYRENQVLATIIPAGNIIQKSYVTPFAELCRGIVSGWPDDDRVWVDAPLYELLGGPAKVMLRIKSRLVWPFDIGIVGFQAIDDQEWTNYLVLPRSDGSCGKRPAPFLMGYFRLGLLGGGGLFISEISHEDIQQKFLCFEHQGDAYIRMFVPNEGAVSDAEAGLRIASCRWTGWGLLKGRLRPEKGMYGRLPNNSVKAIEILESFGGFRCCRLP